MLKSNLMQKHGIVAINLAREFINMESGDRLETVAAYAEKYNAARGTVQSSIKLLKDSKAIDIQSRGHLGTYINFIDYEKLWEFTDFGNCLGVMPLPYSKLYEGLATGLYKVAEESVLPINIAYMRGSRMRVDGILKGRYDFAVMSKFSAKAYVDEGMEIECIISFGKCSYVNKHAIVLADKNKNKVEEGMKVAIDKASYDIYAITKKILKDINVTYIEMPYNQILSKILSGEVDAAVWSIDEILEKNIDLKYVDLGEVFKGEDSEAVIVVNSKEEGMKNFLKQFINIKKVKELQKQVVLGEIVPSY